MLIAEVCTCKQFIKRSIYFSRGKKNKCNTYRQSPNLCPVQTPSDRADASAQRTRGTSQKPDARPEAKPQEDRKRTRAPNPTPRETESAPPSPPDKKQTSTRASTRPAPFPLRRRDLTTQHVVQKRFSRDLGGHDVLPYPEGGEDQRQEAGVRAQESYGVHPRLRHHHHGWRAHVHAQGEAEALRDHDGG